MYKSRKRNEEQDFYCLVECGCGRKYKPEDIYICYICKKIKCQYCTRIEGQLFRCKAGCSNQFTTSTKVKNTKFCCNNCLECPICFSPLITKSFNGKFCLSCPSCYWNSLKAHIAKGKKEEFDTYIQRMNEETCNGFLKKMYNAILNQLTNDPIISNKTKNKLEGKPNKESYNDIVRKAMEEGEQNIDNFEKNNNEELEKKEKMAKGKYEYNDEYLNNEENKYISLKIINKLLPCYNDYTQNFNSLEEVQKAFNTNDLSLNAMTGLEQRHNNPILQNTSVLNQFPKFEDAIPRKELFSKYCKECGKILVEEDDDVNQKKEGRILHSYLEKLPIIFINKIDLEQNLIKLRFILINYTTDINISFKEDPNSVIKMVLPAETFNFELDEGGKLDVKISPYKNILVDFKFDEGYKSELTSNTSHIFRFIIKAEFNRIEKENEELTVTCIEYPAEIKFKIK